MVYRNPKIPPNYQTIMPYLIIPDASGFITFTQKVFNAIETHKTMRDEKIIMHGEIMIDDCTIMFADCTEMFKPRTAGMFLYVINADETYKKALELGATSIQKPSDQPYGRSCGILDAFGNTWWITSL